MSRNMGPADRFIRVLLAIVVGVLYWRGIVAGTLATVLGIIAVLFLVTGVIGYCVAYVPFKIDTRKKKEAEPEKVGMGM